MSEVKHSPLLWKIDDNGSVVDSSGRSVVVAGFAYQTGYAPRECTGRINDRFIVSAVNAHAAVEAMAQALEKARPILESELQSMCESYCPPCKEGDVFDYSKLKQPELGWITATEEALDNTDAALDAYRATQNKDVRG